ncbi:MAG: DNA-binding protein [Eubacterium callanderi]|uniref:DNA-binding protein n=1 Tax=Eubacterium callanderi TaxID=53442 RepID=UPI0039910571
MLFTIFYMAGAGSGARLLLPSPLWPAVQVALPGTVGSSVQICEAPAGALWLHPSGCCHGNGGTGLEEDIKFVIFGLIYGLPGWLWFFVAAVFAMPMVLLFRRLSGPPAHRHPVLTFACGCSVATLAELFYDRRMCL